MALSTEEVEREVAKAVNAERRRVADILEEGKTTYVEFAKDKASVVDVIVLLLRASATLTPVDGPQGELTEQEGGLPNERWPSSR